MNLLHELKPYDSELDNWKNHSKVPHNLQPLKLIYQELHKERPDIGAYEVKLNCGSCVWDMCKALYNIREELRKTQTVDYKGIKPTITKIKPTEVVEVSKEMDEIIKDPGQYFGEPVLVKDLKWGELRKYATSKGIDIKGKNKATILEELNGL